MSPFYAGLLGFVLGSGFGWLIIEIIFNRDWKR